MIQTTIKIDGMMCGMCEAHICDTIRNNMPDAKKVAASHSRGEVSFLTERAPDEDALRAMIDATGYTFVSMTSAPYEKKGWFRRK